MCRCTGGILVLSVALCVGPCSLDEGSAAENDFCLSGDLASCSVTQSHYSEHQTQPGEESVKATSKLISGKTPERLSVADTSGVHLSIKTAGKYHEPRLALIMLTWLQTVLPEQARTRQSAELASPIFFVFETENLCQPPQVYIVTDDGAEDEWTIKARKMGFHVILSNGCQIGHCAKCLCCKSGVEYEQYFTALESGINRNTRWFCHIDDDMYVNMPALMALLTAYDPLQQKLYFGRWSLSRKTKLQLEEFRVKHFPEHKSTEYGFGTGALYCISAALMAELEPYFRGHEAFMATGQKLQLTDDMTVGAVIEGILGYNFTDVTTIYSQLNAPESIPPTKIKHVISISYGSIKINDRVLKRCVRIPNARFSEDADPTRFLSYHCLLQPTTSWCEHTNH